LPVRVVAVRDRERYRAAERAAVPDARRYLGAVGLDLHPAAPAVAELATREVAVDVLGPQLEARGEAFHDRREARAVRLPRRCEAERHDAPSLVTERRSTSTGRARGPGRRRRRPAARLPRLCSSRW